VSRHETYASRPRPTCSAALIALLAALGASACQNRHATWEATVDTLDAKIATEALARTIGVAAVEDQRAALVQESTTDQALKLRLNDALIFDPLLPPSEISLAVEDGHVKLTGSVGTFFDSVEAGDVVSRLYRVSSVDNQLELRQPDAALCLLGAQ
jgi:osmotically-inducible protein OsmY